MENKIYINIVKLPGCPIGTKFYEGYCRDSMESTFAPLHPIGKTEVLPFFSVEQINNKEFFKKVEE